MVYPDNCLDFLKQTTQFLGYSTQVLPARIIGISITLICLAPPLPLIHYFSLFQLFPCYTTEILLKYFIPSSGSSCQNLSFQKVSNRTTTTLFAICSLFKDALSNFDELYITMNVWMAVNSKM